MNINLPNDQQAFLSHLVASGRFASLDEAVSEGIRLLAWQERLKKEIQLGLEQADRGELLDHDTVFAQLRAMATALPEAHSEQ